MSQLRYGVSWLEWKEPLKPGEEPDHKAPKIRKQQYFDTPEERTQFVEEQVERDDFLYVLGEWSERLLT